MTESHATLTLEQLWQFSLHYYGVREIKEACLALQNRHQGNVNLLLLLRWLDEQGLGLSAAQFEALQSSLCVTEALLSPYRALRRQCKQHLPDTLYRQTLHFELLLEKQQQHDLIRTLNESGTHRATQEPLTTRYCHQLGAQHLIALFCAPLRRPSHRSET